MEHRRTIHYDPTRRQRVNRLPGHAKARVSIWSVITDSFQRGLTGQLLVQPLWFMACPSPSRRRASWLEVETTA